MVIAEYQPVRQLRITELTHKQVREQRIDTLKRVAELIGVRWGGIEKGGIISVYFGDGLYQIRGLPRAERLMRAWQRWHDQGDMKWYWWNFAVFNYPDEQCLEAYRRLIGGMDLEVGAAY